MAKIKRTTAKTQLKNVPKSGVKKVEVKPKLEKPTVEVRVLMEANLFHNGKNLAYGKVYTIPRRIATFWAHKSRRYVKILD